MGSLVVPGPKAGAKGSPRPGPVSESPSFGRWFPEFLREELKPYPGRGRLMLRIVLAATLTTLAIVTFRVPGAAIGGYYTLLLPRDSPRATLRAAVTLLLAFALSLTYILLGAMLLVDYPLSHFLWVIGSFFLSFFALSIVTNYAAGSAFAVLIVLAVPTWDTPAPTALLVAANLWTAGSVALAAGVTVLVEYAFSLFETTDELQAGLDDRLATAEAYLTQGAEGQVQPDVERKLHQLAMVGVSRLRQLARSGGAAADETARRSTTVSLVGRLIDLLSSLQNAGQTGSGAQPRLVAMAKRIRDLRLSGRGNQQPPAMPGARPAIEKFPVLFELERTLDSLQLSLSRNPGVLSPLDQAEPAAPPFFKADAFSNPAHLNFALRGCLAASLCYLILNAVAWPGLSTALLTCTITALTSIGSSRQKQLLRISGAVVGGLFFGIGSQILILPMLDSVVGFLVLLAVVTTIAAWFTTASPRISYFGSQIGLAFYLIQLRGPFPQTNLAIARDNVMGILLGLTMMWLAFDTLGSKPAAQVMSELFATNFKLMAQLAKPWPGGQPANLPQLRALRDSISQNFAAVNAQADAVLFEIGFDRKRSLALRQRLLGWQPRLRSIFLLEVALLQYRTQIAPQTLPRRILEAQTAFDGQVSGLFEALAAEHTRDGAMKEQRTRQAFAELKEAIFDAYHGEPTARAQAILTLSSHLVELSTAITSEKWRVRGPARELR